MAQVNISKISQPFICQTDILQTKIVNDKVGKIHKGYGTEPAKALDY